MAHNVAYRFIRKLRWQFTVDSVKPLTASEYAQFSDDVIVSAITFQWIKADRQLNFIVALTDDWCSKETEKTEITCNIQYTHE